jgi:hypothetical protein
MIATAGKYTNVRAASKETRRRLAGGSIGRRPVNGAPAIIVPQRAKMVNMKEYFWRELRDGGIAKQYLEREKATIDQQIRRVARRMCGVRANSKSDMELLASIPARLFHRWRQEDPDFWADDSNLKRLKRDNPDLPVYIR